ncbi:uncharacterized protein [Lepeophtheirus salmonis]|uniref:uncharacterized protein n=1 Tax=Lepeophtheirus salmonis TaxID=72036 RepID=UPI003AF3DD1A
MIKDKNTKVCPIAWVSKRIKRVMKSTLAAETLAILEGAELCFYINNLVYEICGFLLEVILKTDCRSLKECIQATKQVEDKRLKIEIAMLKEFMERSEIKKVVWVQTKNQLANCFTKYASSTLDLIRF